MTRKFFVPGRVELFGKHVDYGGGPSLTCAINHGIHGTIDAIDQQVIEVIDSITKRSSRIPLRADVRSNGANGGKYIAAVARRLSRDFPPLTRGVRVSIESSLPRSSGMSSSSAFVVLLTLAAAEVNELQALESWQRNIPDRFALAEYCAAIEMGGAFGEFSGDHGVGTRGGAQDHVAILCNQSESVGSYKYLPASLVGSARFPADWSIVIGVSGIRATKSGGARREYNNASDLVRALLALWNKSEQRSDHSLSAALGSSPDAAERMVRVARHSDEAPLYLARLEQFRAETERIVPQALDAIGSGDSEALAALGVESQQRAEVALRNQIPETMFLARSAMAAGAYASSAFGAGFGGSVWAIVDSKHAQHFIGRWRKLYLKEFPRQTGKAEWLTARPAGSLESSD